MLKQEENHIKVLKKILKLIKNFALYAILFFISVSYERGGIERIELADRTSGLFLREMKKKHKANCYGFGGGYRSAQIYHVSICLEIKRDFEINDARKLIRDMITEFIEINNKNKELIIYYDNQKCTNQNLFLSLAFKNNSGEREALVINAKNWISYCIYDKTIHDYIDIGEEEYEKGEFIPLNKESKL
jgi:hypothetical protein